VGIPAAAFNDLAALARLRTGAADAPSSALREAAGQFEALLVQTMLKGVRTTSLGSGLFDSDSTDMYRDLLDQQLALQISRGRGLGLADMLARQLGDGESSAPARRSGLSARPAPVARPAADAGTPSSPAEFVQRMLPHARAVADKLGVSARAVLAQAALESGWGTRTPARPDGSPSHNLFGIKAGASWRGDSVSVPTLEYEDGVARRVQERFRAYASPGASFEDYAALVAGDPRYAEALARGDDVASFGQALQAAGYATDPDYGRKLATLADGEQMRAALAGLDH
jgi:peptidoglycan hydrolase FlgJ